MGVQSWDFSDTTLPSSKMRGDLFRLKGSREKPKEDSKTMSDLSR